MAGFFGLFDYNKPGKGVAKDEPKKPAPIHFLQLVVRKFFKLITLNLLYFVVLLPLIAVFLLYLFNIMQIKPEEIVSPLLTLIVMAAGSLPNIVNYLLLIVSAVLFGPATAAVSYILRRRDRFGGLRKFPFLSFLGCARRRRPFPGTQLSGISHHFCLYHHAFLYIYRHCYV